MNLLQEHPHLFANGKFEAIDSETNEQVEINGIRNGLLELKYISSLYCQYANLCTLIARPIEGMSDEEKLTLFRKDRSYKQEDWETCVKKWVDDVCQYAPYGMQPDDPELDLLEDLRCSREGLLYLLSIGVYPFDQSHFEDGTVLNINEV